MLQLILVGVLQSCAKAGVVLNYLQFIGLHYQAVTDTIQPVVPTDTVYVLYNFSSQYKVNVDKAMHTFKISGRRADIPNKTIAFRLLTHTGTSSARKTCMC